MYIIQSKPYNTFCVGNALKIYSINKATRSPEISRQQVQKLTPQFLFYIYWI